MRRRSKRVAANRKEEAREDAFHREGVRLIGGGCRGPQVRDAGATADGEAVAEDVLAAEFDGSSPTDSAWKNGFEMSP